MQTIKAPKKLIEVALPLDAINDAAAKEKSIRHGHPSTLHIWWARRPLAAARAVIFAQLYEKDAAVPSVISLKPEALLSMDRKQVNAAYTGKGDIYIHPGDVTLKGIMEEARRITRNVEDLKYANPISGSEICGERNDVNMPSRRRSTPC